MVVLLVVAGVVIVGLMVFLSMEPCPSCGSRGTLRWLHQKKGGGPDLRFSTNYRMCRCGWSEGPGRAMSQADTATDFAAGAARVQERRLAAEARAPEKQERASAELRRVRLEEEERAIIWLLKYIAKGDGRMAEGEKRELRERIHGLFPPERQTVVERWAEELTIDSGEREHMVRIVAALPLEGRAEIYAALVSMAVADGKETKSETTRLAKIRDDLGLD